MAMSPTAAASERLAGSAPRSALQAALLRVGEACADIWASRLTRTGIILVAAMVQGAIFSLVRALIARGGARAFERWTGEWPGD